MKILITGGCGFVGSNLAKHFIKLPWVTGVTVFDNLHRRGSELNIKDLTDLGIKYVHGDVRNKEDLFALPAHDIMVEASAEPSVYGDPDYTLGTNLIGAINCLDYARKHNSIFVFLSTSRVYSIGSINRLISETSDAMAIRLEPTSAPHYAVDEQFPTTGKRTIYGTSKLAAELLVEEYHNTYGLRTVINRCGLIAGPGQFGKTDQGVVTYWLAAHEFGFPLIYKGYGGHGKQVRDILHVFDLAELLECELDRLGEVNGKVFNVGGGEDNAISLLQLTGLCEELTRNSMAQIGEDPNTNPSDVPWYVSDNSLIKRTLGWSPKRTVGDILRDTYDWIRANHASLKPLFMEGSK